MGRQLKTKKDYLLTYDELIKLVPQLESKLTKENSHEFSIQLLEFTKLLIEEIKYEKKLINQ